MTSCAICLYLEQTTEFSFVGQQAVRATTEYSPRGYVSWNPAGFTDGTDQISSRNTSRPELFSNAVLNGAILGATQSSPSRYQTERELLRTSTDIGSAHTRTNNSETLRPPSSGSFRLADAIDRDRASLSEAPGSRALHKGLPGWCPPQGTAEYRPGFSSHADLECRLTLPRGTRGHKRPRLEDKLKEVINNAFIFDGCKPPKCTVSTQLITQQQPDNHFV